MDQRKYVLVDITLLLWCMIRVSFDTVTRDESEGMHGVERVDEISRDADTPNSSVGKLRSVVWQHFKITEKDNGKPVKSICRYCAKEFTCETKNGTSSMSKHINKICKKKPRVLPPNLSRYLQEFIPYAHF
jgi:hypothetical protein